MAAALQICDREVLVTSPAHARRSAHGLRRRAAVPAARSERSANGDQGDVELQLPTALQRRYRHALPGSSDLRAQLDRLAAELLHGRALRLLQQYRPYRGAADTDRSGCREQRPALPLRVLSVPRTNVDARLRDGARALHR